MVNYYGSKKTWAIAISVLRREATANQFSDAKLQKIIDICKKNLRICEKMRTFADK